MKRYFFLFIFLVPILTFGQLTKVDKIAIEDYSNILCNCVDDLMNTLGAKTIEFIEIMYKEGVEVMEKEMADFYNSVTEEQFNEQIALFNTMNSKEFQGKIEACDQKKNMAPEITESIESKNGEGSEYFLGYLKYHMNCEITNMLLEIAVENSKTEK